MSLNTGLSLYSRLGIARTKDIGCLSIYSHVSCAEPGYPQHNAQNNMLDLFRISNNEVLILLQHICRKAT